MLTKKSLVLTGVNNDSERAVLTVEKEGDIYKGRVRLYNFSAEPEGILSLGFYQNGEVKKCGLARSSHMLYTFKAGEDMAENFSCAVVKIDGSSAKPILYGSTSAKVDLEGELAKISGDVLDKSTFSEVEEALDEAGVDYDDEEKEEIDKAIMQTLEEDKCAKCKYKKCFFGEEEEKSNSKFIDEVLGQVDELFKSHPSESFLEQAIANSKWVRVEFDGDGDYYILGLIYDENGEIKYLCYGVPGIYQKEAPKNLSGYPVWFPLDKENSESFGYWLTYQDAESGESVKAIDE